MGKQGGGRGLEFGWLDPEVGCWSPLSQPAFQGVKLTPSLPPGLGRPSGLMRGAVEVGNLICRVFVHSFIHSFIHSTSTFLGDVDQFLRLFMCVQIIRIPLPTMTIDIRHQAQYLAWPSVLEQC